MTSLAGRPAVRRRRERKGNVGPVFAAGQLSAAGETEGKRERGGNDQFDQFDRPAGCPPPVRELEREREGNGDKYRDKQAGRQRQTDRRTDGHAAGERVGKREKETTSLTSLAGRPAVRRR